MSSSATPYGGQHYADLKRNCIKDKTLFEDPEFPATNASVFFRKPPPGTVVWKRPGVSGSGPALKCIRDCRKFDTCSVE